MFKNMPVFSATRRLTNMEMETMLFALPLNVDIEKAAENLQMELTDLQCDTNLIQKCSET
jgi:hypothetical protein